MPDHVADVSKVCSIQNKGRGTARDWLDAVEVDGSKVCEIQIKGPGTACDQDRLLRSRVLGPEFGDAGLSWSFWGRESNSKGSGSDGVGPERPRKKKSRKRR